MHYVIRLCVVVATVVATGGCGQSAQQTATPTPDKAPLYSPTNPANAKRLKVPSLERAAPAAESAATPAAAPAKPPARELLVTNRGFEDLPDSPQIFPWKIVRWVDHAGAAVKVPAEGKAEGKFALELTEGAVEVQRVIDSLDDSARGATFVAEINGIAHAPGQLMIQIKYTVGDEEMYLCGAEHPGDGQWSTITASKALPKNIKPDSVLLRIIRQAGTKEGKLFKKTDKVLVDDASLTLVPSQ